MTVYDRVFTVGSVAVTALLGAALRPLFAARFGENTGASLVYGLLVCLPVIGASYFLLRRAITGPALTFQLVFFGGIVGRFLLFGAATAIAFAIPGLNGQAAMVAILAGFLPLTALEIFCAVRGHAAERRTGPTEIDTR